MCCNVSECANANSQHHCEGPEGSCNAPLRTRVAVRCALTSQYVGSPGLLTRPLYSPPPSMYGLLSIKFQTVLIAFNSNSL